MRFNSLQSRIITLFIALILIVQLVGYFFIREAIDSNARLAIQADLKVSERIFGRLLDQNAQKLILGANVLAKDYGFRQAMGTQDNETIKSMLINHGDRIGASFSMLIDVDRKITASTSTALAANFQQSILPLLVQAEQIGSASSTAIVEGRPYQLVMVPIKAPITISWVVMAVPIDKGIAADMRQLSSLQVSILTSVENGPWQSDISTLPANEIKALAAQVPRAHAKDAPNFDFHIGPEEYSARILQLAHDTTNTAIVVLQLSVNQAVEPYRNLQFKLLVLSIFGVIFTSVLSVVTAKRITEPLRQLADTAKRLGSGDYNVDITVKRKDEIGDLSTTFLSMRDDIAQREQAIAKLAYWDPLTNLPNRALFILRLNQAIESAERQGRSCFVLMMDLDRFKHVNDVMGHRFGDLILKELASRLSNDLGIDKEKLARLGGDEFVILMPNADLLSAQNLATRILLAMEKPISLEDQTVDIGAGIGIAGYPEHAADAELLLSHAEVAMYTAKRTNGGAVTYAADIDKSSEYGLSLLSELRDALEQNAFRLYVQPKVDIKSGLVVAVEALIRWEHPSKGLIFPDKFIPFAEKTGFIRLLTRWVINEAAYICSKWLENGKAIKMSLNLSTRDLLDQDLPEKFAEILLRHSLPPHSFILEITESAMMDDPIRAQQTLEKLHSMGVQLSIDDFGTGYSSLAYLKHLPVDELKIDKSFVLNMESDAGDEKIVKSTIDLGHNMGLRVVAEGVESMIAMRMLKEMGCDQAQGFYISRPIPASNFIAWRQSWESLNQELNKSQNAQ